MAQSRVCSTNQCRLKDSTYPCTPSCCDNCVNRRVLNSTFTRRLNCISKTITGAKVLNDGCGNNEIQDTIKCEYFLRGKFSRSKRIQGTDSQRAFFNTDGFDFQLRNKVSSGILNEFDDDGDGLFDRAEISGSLIPINRFNTSIPFKGSFDIYINLTV